MPEATAKLIQKHVLGTNEPMCVVQVGRMFLRGDRQLFVSDWWAAMPFPGTKEEVRSAAEAFAKAQGYTLE